MAEKPRLKKSDEILGSIAAETPRSARGASSRAYTGTGQERRANVAEPYIPDINPEDEDFDPGESILPSAQTLAEKLMAHEDKRRKLNFEKYELPKQSQSNPQAKASAAMEIPVAKAAEPVAFETSADIPATPNNSKLEKDSAAQAKAPAPVSFEPQPTVSPVVMEYAFESFEQPSDPVHSAREFRMESANAPEQSRRSIRERARRRVQPRPEPEPQTAEQPEFSFEPEAQAKPQTRPRIIEATPTPKPQPEPQYIPEPLSEPVSRPAPEPAAPPPPKPESPEEIAERRRKEFLDRISSQFERQFDERFEQGALPSTSDSKPRQQQPSRESIFENPAIRARPPISQKPDIIPAGSPDEDFFTAIQRQKRDGTLQEAEVSPQSDPNAQDFLSRFNADIEREEEQRTEEFKETLAEKFMRERERYLKELGITMKESEVEAVVEQNASGQPHSFTHPQRRKLDFQIQPEMHLGDGEVPPPVRPRQNPSVTYNRGGSVVKPQLFDDLEAPIPARPVSRPVNTAKKTSEQLLIEHGRLAKAVGAPQQKQAQLKFKFETPEEQARNQQHTEKKNKIGDIIPKDKWPRRIVFISMACGLIAILLLMLPLLQYLHIFDRLEQLPEASVPPVAAFEQDTLDVYETRSFDQTAKVNNVVFKKAGVALKNVDVNEYVVIDGIETSGKIRLEDVNVNSAISLKSSGVDTLELHNVKAQRVIINNPDTDMTISATGNTDINVVEVRTPSTVRQLDIGGDFPGIRAMVVTAADTSSGSVNAKLDGLRLDTLTAEARDSILSFENNSQAESMSCYGSLSLTGSGRVVNLSIGAKSGQGAGDGSGPKPVSLIVKGVNIVNLNVQSPASLGLSTKVDSLATSDDISIDGEGGSVAALTVNPGQKEGRIVADISGVSIQSVYANTESRFNLGATASVNSFVANASSFILGNKVNQLIANANNVVYDLKPDSLKVADGITEPANRADNPNLDLDAPSAPPEDGDASPAPDTPGDLAPEISADTMSTCGHPAESGGFANGDGSKDSPFEVSSPLHLAHVGSHLNSFFRQTANINVSNEPSLKTNFKMIGSGAAPFTGVYDGDGFAVSGVTISSSDENVGLFAVNSGVIQNVWLVSGHISSAATNRAFAGGLVGLNLDGGAIRACSNGASVFGTANTYTGGIAGYNFGARINDCFNYGVISGVDTVGGLAGANRQSAIIAGSYNAGTIEGRDVVGAIAGNNEEATITNCYYLVDTADSGIGMGSGTAIPKTSNELASADMAVELAAGNESSLWLSGQTSGSGYRYPIHRKP